MKLYANIRSIVLVSILVVAILGSVSVAAHAQDASGDGGGNDIEVTARTAAPDEHGRYLFLVRFQEPSIAAYRGGIDGLASTNPRAAGQRKLDVSSPAARAYHEFLATRQVDYLSQINDNAGRAVDVRAQVFNVLNAAAVWLSLDEARAIAALDFVRSVHIDEVDTVNTDVGPQWVGAPVFWDGDTPSGMATRGEGMLIGILDGGVDHTHPSFAETADDGHVHENPYGPGVFVGECDGGHPDAVCNDKLVGSYNLHTDSKTPEDTTGHGTHVSSTAAGNPVVASNAGLNIDISGVAPRANLISYKVCEDGSCQSIARVEAVDLAISDGADVLNHSIGDSFPWTSAVGLAFLDAHEAGVYVSASAGNNGPESGSLNRGAPWAGIIANSSHGRVLGHLVDAAGLTDMVSVVGSGPEIDTDVTADLIDVAVVDPDNPLGCEPFPANALDNAIALMERGCPFADKVNHATDAGAVAVIVFNNAGGPPIRMGALEDTTIPAVMLDNEDGLAVQAALTGGADPESTVHAASGIATKDGWDEVIARLSSRGPASFDVVKPDVAAPGTNILAAEPGSDYGLRGGTSMATPHNTGAAALIIAEHPDWTPAEIISAVALTAQPDAMVKEDGVTPADPFDRGSGRLSLAAVARAGFVMSETIENFENANPLEDGDPRTLNLASMMNRECVGECTWERTLTSVLPAAQEYDVSGVAPAGMTVSVDPDNFTLDPGGSVTLEITADVDGMPLDEWFFAEIVIEPAQPGDVAVARMPIVVLNPTPPPPVALIDVSPDNIEVVMEAGDTVTETLTIGNTGDLGLDWDATAPEGNIVLHDNGPLVTHPGEGPDGSDHSVLQNSSVGLTTLGSNVSPQDGDHFRIADNFTVTGEWEIDTVTFFAYQTGSSTDSTFTQVNYRVWDGPPNDPASTVIFGDTTTNRLQSSAWTNAYRVSETTVGTTRPIMEVVAEGGFTLTPGTYWIDGQLDGSLSSGPWQPAISILGEGTTGDGLYMNAEGWQEWLDGGLETPQGLPFEVGGTANCWDPAEIDWLDVAPATDTVAPEASQEIEITFDSTDLAEGEHQTVLCVTSNASNHPLVLVPVTLRIPGDDVFSDRFEE